MKDECFIRGQAPMTKEEIRSIAISKLDLKEAYGLLDIGAGTGSVCIEAKVLHPHLNVTAIEQNSEACELIRANKLKWNCEGLQIIQDRAPSQQLIGSFDRFFIGGSEGALQDVLVWIRENALADSIVVVTCITLETASEALNYLSEAPFTKLEGVQIHAQRLEKLGRYHYFKPNNPVTIYTAHFKGEAL